MVKVNVHQAKTQFSQYLEMVENGIRVVVCKRNIPIVELRPYQENENKRALGQCAQKFEVPNEFFDPLPRNTSDKFNNPK